MDINKTIQEADARERREWAPVRLVFKVVYFTLVVYLLWPSDALWLKLATLWRSLLG